MLVRGISGGGGGGNWTFSLNEVECYTSPKSFTCKNAFYFVCVDASISRGYQAYGYVDNGVLHNEYAQNNIVPTYNNGKLTLSGGYNAEFSRVYIAYQ